LIPQISAVSVSHQTVIKHAPHKAIPQSSELRKDEKTLLAGILALEESISEIRENMVFFDSLKDLNVCVVRLNPVDYESILKSQEHSLCVMKAQRCVVVHVLNGHKAKAEKWLQKFVERVTDVGE
jgi:hypothetical protein